MTAPSIDSYSFGSIRIDGELYREDIIIFPDGVMTGWRREKGHSLVPEDLADILKNPPDVLVVGTGKSGRMGIPASTRQAIEAVGIEFLAAPTDRAVDEYMLRKETASTAAAFHLTC